MTMRIRLWTAATLLLMPSALLAQSAPGSTQPQVSPTTPEMVETGLSNSVDVGVRGTHFGSGSDEARFERYRDLRNGPVLEGFRYANDTASRTFKAQADHVGYRDQRYSAAYNDYGKLK